MELIKISGIGDKTLKLFEKLGITTIEDLVSFYPYRYNILKPTTLNNCIEEPGIVTGTINSNIKVSFIKKNFNRLSFQLLVENKLINVSIFNRSFYKQHLTLNKEISIIGKYNEKNNSFLASDIKFTPITKTTIEPIYHLVKGLNHQKLNKFILDALNYDFKLDDYIPTELSKKYEFDSKKDTIKIIHNTNLEKIKKARLRLIYEELFIFAFKIAYLKDYNQKTIGLTREVNFDDIKNFIDTLPFKLTEDQNIGVKDIYKDLISHKRMNRLLLGDVGSGKTIIAIIAMFINYQSNYQSALMAPTELLAMQHYFEIKTIFKNIDINIEVLVGSMTKKEKDNIKKRLASNEIDIIIGTHALLSENVEFNNLGLVITDEQHRFGVNQRSVLQNKGKTVDVLYMSATPIPRTYALTIYGDMDTSLIKTKPNGRKEIKTYVKTETELKDVLFKMLEEIKKGHQIYVVAPAIEEGEMDVYDVSKLKEKLDIAFNNKVNIKTLHGKVKQKEKDLIMNDFKNNKINILISTTVIEVGINVANATMMVIFDADRFGLATLHQLRGRVGRNNLESFCYLISNKDTPRLKVLEESNDGFYISECDFKLRKEGDLFGNKQSGDMVFKVADLKRDYNIFLKVKEDVDNYLETIKLNPNYQKIIESLNFID